MTPPIIALVVVLVIAVWAIYTYNSLVHARNKVSEAFSGIDVQLRLRHDLVPNLVQVVKGYAEHEKSVLAAAAAARANAIAAKKPEAIGQAEEELATRLTSVIALSESYPDLKASEEFRRLVEELSEVEDEVQAARQIYNSNVEYYNSRAQVFPAMVVSNWMHPISFDFINFAPADLDMARSLVGEFAT